jgi:hypothetical protein
MNTTVLLNKIFKRYLACIVLGLLFENDNSAKASSITLSRHNFLCKQLTRKDYLEAKNAIEIQEEMQSHPVVLWRCVVKLLFPSPILRYILIIKFRKRSMRKLGLTW